MQRRSPLSVARAGFTLIEILAVIVLIGILMVILLPRLLGTKDIADEQIARAHLTEIAAAIGEYEQKFGDYPPSSWPEKWGIAPNTTNVGAECLVQSLWSAEWAGTALGEDSFVNTDGDETKQAIGRIAAPALFELADSWGNPIAYVLRRDYGKPHVYVVVDGETGELTEYSVQAATNPETKGFRNATKYQLVSAGLDGQFGTADDLGNWSEDP
jgi:prepilin-type N-terminal cleavage/methylation domain-containing protein